MSVNRSRSSHSLYNNAIFGTPTEPLFNNEENGICPEILQDWLDNMALMNARDIETATVTQNIFSHGSWSECVFLMCDRFELPCQAKYAALEIFDRFMLKHLQDLYSHVQNTKSVRKKSDWECILERVKNQAFLRILSCCQIASKLNSHYKVITVKKAKRCLQDAGYSYSCESILQSEMRVLKTLYYTIPKTSCLDYIEILLELLGQNLGKDTLDLKVYHDTAIKILTFVCLHRHSIYDRLYVITAAIGAAALASSQEQRLKLAEVKMDKMLLSATVVVAAVHLNDDRLTEEVMIQLNKINGVPIQDLQDFMKVILEMIQLKITSFKKWNTKM
ncbi:cyclin N-terminal domain-containing protein 1-like isoform X1 [Biomphalaria glabrata]|uniref:Cyclin N-terminal domain-containing protein 1-like isoform X1 n=2 Tax=Biomphalaria glabrata TaxID=6526 RepID=A0A9U8E722_BIOGL|nr:cyclin N-terminal domain-containing protein 1-like isoform X1 [Biomphalaria glabrata]KAI8795664.1 cyclin N-terminal domain-containing protein 1 isoform X1 [Biomphalaria glabrata]